MHGSRLLLLAAMLASGCAASSFREKVTPFPPGTPKTVPWTLNRELLMPVNQQILVVVELAAGHVPNTDALDTLARVAARYGERPARWTVGTMRDIGALDPHSSYVFVRYVGEQLQKWGLSYTTTLRGRTVYVIEINQERHRRWRAFIPERHLEGQTLVHEYGHMIGLPPWDHGYYTMFPSFYDGAHCVNPDCALSKPRSRALLYGFWHTLLGRHYLEDYCAACRAAIAAAKQRWRVTA